MMKKRLREKLPHGLRKLARRIIVRLVSSVIHFIRDILNIATTNGLDLKRELHWLTKTDVRQHGTPALDVRDFLFLMDVLAEGVGDADDLNAWVIRSSIIIPVYNQVNYTFRCLRALIHEIDLRETEVIVVNNGSSDETKRMLSYMKGLVCVIDNSENKGFVGACNQGAAEARGEYLIFLNNDTEVQPGWLKNLLETMSEQSVGAVGSMLLYPDGLLQEAGGIVWKDGNAGNYGRGQDPKDSRFTFAREVDYCSGAALMVRKNLFARLGGFDNRYAPAYYEDTDLCFGVRSLGFKVVYQPLARVIHDEGATAGIDIHQGFKQYQEINRAKFVEKWRDVLLQDQFESRPELASKAADRRRGPRIIIFDNGVPTPDRDSGSFRMFMILKTLAAFGRPVFVPVNQAPAAEYESLLLREGVEVVRRADYQKLIEGGEFQVAILSRVAVADEVLSNIRRINKRIRIIFDTVDLHFLRFEREYQLTGNKSIADEAALLKKQELRLAAASDQVWCITENDKQALEREVPTANIKVIPNIHTLHGRGKTFDEREGLLFIGSFMHRPNQDALHFFVKEIYPLLLEALPGLKFYVVGSHMTEETRAFASEHVKILGHVPDVGPLFDEARLFVSPLRYGSGMKGKIGQALSYGLPVVTTSIGAEGIGLRHGQEALIVDEPKMFAEAVIQAYRQGDVWQRLSDNGYRHVQEHFAPQLVGEKIIHEIRESNNVSTGFINKLSYKPSSA